jgi:hypothetical protein
MVHTVRLSVLCAAEVLTIEILVSHNTTGGLFDTPSVVHWLVHILGFECVINKNKLLKVPVGSCCVGYHHVASL